jgi:hypothetical protein
MNTFTESPILNFFKSTNVKFNNLLLEVFILTTSISLIYFLTFAFKRPGGDSFIWLSDGFIYYLLLSFLIPFFIKKNSTWKIFKIVTLTLFLSFFIPVGWITLGFVLLAYYIGFMIILLSSYFLSKIIDFTFTTERSFVLTKIMFIIILTTLLVLIHKDLTVKKDLRYNTNSIFKTIEECDSYVLPKREQDCRNSWTETHKRWRLQNLTANINLNSNLEKVAGSNNYQYFPEENIKDIKIGSGKLAEYGDIVKVRTIEAVLNDGSKYFVDDLLELKISAGIAEYYSYVFGVVGMRTGGIREITFKTNGFWFKSGVLAKGKIMYTIELVSIDD